MRRLFTFCSALSLLLFVAVCVLWVRSMLGAFRLALLESNTSYIFIGCDGSGVVIEQEPLRAVSTFITRPTPARFLGFGFTNAPATVQANPRLYPGSAALPTPYLYTRVPYWFLALLTLILPALQRARRREAGAGRCPTCG